jgi:glycosyltransferase involved in cell wall biosynthesis
LASICVPVFNGADHLEEALDSILAQDYPRLEVVVSDNASDDATAEIVSRYARSDPRIRYRRNAINVGAHENFRLAIAAATGDYCTWLAHDDTLASPQYVSATIEFMERNRDVVLCACDLVILDHEVAGARSQTSFPEIHPDKPWTEARKEFFRWPQRPVHYVIYGMYRREQLLTMPLEGRTYRRMPIVTDMEFAALTALAIQGRIVALPALLRASRCRSSSSFHREQQTLRGVDKLILGLRTRCAILGTVLRSGLHGSEKAGLLRVALDNFLHGNFERPTDYTYIVKLVDREVRMLRRTAAERGRLVRRLETDLHHLRRRAGLPELFPREKTAAVDPTLEEDDGPSRLRELRDLLRAQFRPPGSEQTARLAALYAECARLRPLCDERLRTIERLHAEAEALLSTSGPAESGPAKAVSGPAKAGHYVRT